MKRLLKVMGILFLVLGSIPFIFLALQWKKSRYIQNPDQYYDLNEAAGEPWEQLEKSNPEIPEEGVSDEDIPEAYPNHE